MSARLEMLQVARLAPQLLGDSANLVSSYLRGQQTPDGGFADRAGMSDLYYSVFGIEGLFALRADLPLPAFGRYLQAQGDGAGLDLVHLSCLARCWATLPRDAIPDSTRKALLARVETHRSRDGGYHAQPNSESGTLYGCFLALGAYQDAGRELPDPQGVLHCVAALRADDGGYANQRDVPYGLTPSTAAAVTLLRQLDQTPDPALASWLLSRAHPQGGFYATPAAPVPDLLSTATALHALSTLGADLDPVREPTLDFIDTLWSSRGAFFGNWDDDILDCEYTFYGLLALGHLAV